ncbi:MAG: YebC/PmpR family DNA-binding transcriptional regulator [Methylococcaceae bacterium TMED69]|nr:YebC/PmpR family DNA-binding transcriptional regulator [Pseudomonadota bacterium]OUU75271.1 MAG: YebC/PmpR family DNA-binding transcriptional regulator [Methylococcaceae bacterium TMED69]
MAGHSKWANIKHRKGRQDAIKGKLFTRLIREISVSARLAGGDINSNPRLRSAVEAANSANMPKEKIDRAIKKGSGGDESQNLEEIRYEGYSPGGAAIIVDCVTDNRNRTVADVRHVFSKAGGNLGTEGCVAFLFKKLGILTVIDIEDEDAFLEKILELDVEDVQKISDNSFGVICAPESYFDVKDLLLDSGVALSDSEITLVPTLQKELKGKHQEQTEKMIDLLEDVDDVQKIYTNAVF